MLTVIRARVFLLYLRYLADGTMDSIRGEPYQQSGRRNTTVT